MPILECKRHYNDRNDMVYMVKFENPHHAEAARRYDGILHPNFTYSAYHPYIEVFACPLNPQDFPFRARS